MVETATPPASDELEVLIRARYPLIYIPSWEEERVEEALCEIAARRAKKVICWSIVRGLHTPGESPTGKRAFPQSTTDPLTALDEVVRQVEPILFVFNPSDASRAEGLRSQMVQMQGGSAPRSGVCSLQMSTAGVLPTPQLGHMGTQDEARGASDGFKDLHPFMRDPSVVRKLRELATHLKSSPKTLVLVSPTLAIPPDLEKDVTVVDFCMPGLAELEAVLERMLRQVAEQGKRIEPTPAQREKVLKASLGLTLKEAENAFARTLIQRGQLSELEIQMILDEKKRVIRKSGILEYFDARDSLGDVGGLENLKEWVRKRSVAFTEEAREFGLPTPKGVLLLGVQGCGKSLCARAISQVWSLPLLRLDMGRIFSGLVGSSEENMRRAISTAESVAPALLWIDEIDKAFAGSGGSGDSDGGTNSRVFGTFLTWMQEKTASVFVIATANNIANLPPELLRKGRFDEIFFVDLPDPAERAEILKIHLGRRQRNPQQFDLTRLAQLSDGFSGSELEQVVVTGLYDAFDRRGPLDSQDLSRAIFHSVPLSKTMQEEIDRLRKWASERARPATLYPDLAAVGTSRALEF